MNAPSGFSDLRRHAVFLSHGGGPLPLLGDPAHATLVDGLKVIAASLPRPTSIIVVSAHWEADPPRITSNDRPTLLYDYGGFPSEAYTLRYPCPGSPTLARGIAEGLGKAGLTSNLDDQRGLDHGVFVPLTLMYPEADIPCVQLSLVRGLDPAIHLSLGRALRAVCDSTTLVIGSGSSFHNVQAFFSPRTRESQDRNLAFEAWLTETCGSHALSETERTQRLLEWKAAPFARYCHPREEHLIPLHVCYGYAGTACTLSVSVDVMGMTSSIHTWAGPPLTQQT